MVLALLLVIWRFWNTPEFKSAFYSLQGFLGAGVFAGQD
jgi:hypothetical protein